MISLFAACKYQGHVYVGANDFGDFYDCYNRKICPSMARVMVIDHGEDKLIVSVSHHARIAQLVDLHRDELFDKDCVIEFNYIRLVFIPRLQKILKDNRIPCKDKDNNDHPFIHVFIMIVANGQIYRITPYCGVYNCDVCVAGEGFESFVLSNYYCHEVHDEKFIEQVFHAYCSYYYEKDLPLTLCNDKDYKIKIINYDKDGVN